MHRSLRSRRPGGGRLHAPAASLFAVLLLCTAARAGEPAPEQEARPGPAPNAARTEPFPLSGSLDLGLVWKRSDHEEDLDLHASLALRWGDAMRDTVTASLSASAWWDLDGTRKTYGYYPFDSIHDTYERRFVAHLHQACAELHRLGPLRRARLGRQSLGLCETLRFDGLRLDSSRLSLGTLGELEAAAFGGLPLHAWESSAHGDALAGARLAWHHGRELRFRLGGAWIRDRAGLWGRSGNTRSTLLHLDGFWTPDPAFSLHGGFLLLSRGTSDLRLDPADLRLTARGTVPGLRLTALADLHVRWTARDDPAAELNPYDPVLGDSQTFRKGRCLLVLPLDDRMECEVGALVYDLASSLDNGPLGRDLVSLHAAFRTRDLFVENLDLAVTADTWNPSDGGSRQGLHGEMRYRHPGPGGDGPRHRFSLRLAGGLAAFARDREDGVLRERVLCFETRLRWWPLAGLRIDARFRSENDDFDVYYRLSLAVGWRF